MRPVIDLTGQRFGRLLVVERYVRTGHRNRTYWRCVCDCGNESIVRGDSLRSSLMS